MKHNSSNSMNPFRIAKLIDIMQYNIDNITKQGEFKLRAVFLF